MINYDSNTQNNKNITFVRILTSALSLFITILIIYKYFFTSPKGEINYGIVILLSFLIILSLSESYDNFSVGKIFSLQKTIEQKDSDISQLKKENLELIRQIVNVCTSVNQQQTNSTVIGLSELVNVRKAGIEEKEKAEAQEEKENSKLECAKTADVREDARKRINYSEVEKIGLNKFLDEFKLRHCVVVENVKLDFYGLDPISSISPIFDGYIKTSDCEIFIEIKKNSRFMVHSWDRIYLMLSKIYHYKKVKNLEAYLVLILVNLKEDEGNYFNISERMGKYFEPAITSGLLKIVSYTLDESESSQIYINES